MHLCHVNLESTRSFKDQSTLLAGKLFVAEMSFVIVSVSCSLGLVSFSTNVTSKLRPNLWQQKISVTIFHKIQSADYFAYVGRLWTWSSSMDALFVISKTVVASKELSTVLTRIIFQSQMLHIIVVIHVSFLSESLSTFTTNMVLDTHVCFSVPIKGTWVIKLTTTKLTSLFLELKLFLFFLREIALIDFVCQGVLF